MPTSGRSVFTTTAADLIRDALGYLSLLAPNEPVNAEDEALGIRRLNGVIARLSISDFAMWAREEKTLPLVLGTATYRVGLYLIDDTPVLPRPVKIVAAWLRHTDGTDLMLTPIGQADLTEVGQKAEAGLPVAYWYERQRDDGYVTLWPVPDTATSADYILHYIQRRPLHLCYSGQDELDFPTAWLPALATLLAVDLAPFYERSSQLPTLSMLASQYLSDAVGFERENAPTYFQPG